MPKSSSKKAKYSSGPIPYAVSQPNRFWRIKKDLPADVYWKKRYWRRRITGRGDYSMNSGDSFGRRWGGLIGSKLGEGLGGLAHSAVSSILGLGAYTIKQNVLLDGRMPAIQNPTSAGGITIRFTEYIGDIITASTPNTFASQMFDINAANSTTFPYLSQLAANFEQFEIEGMLYEFKSTSADALNSTNTALGTVMMATQYDVLDEPFKSKLEMLNYEYASCIKPSESCVHMIECARSQTTVSNLYTLYNTTPPSSADPRLYFLGRFTIATTGFQAASVNVGQLHVTYQVRLLKPKLFMGLGLGFQSFRFFMQNQDIAFNTPFGTQADVDAIFALGNHDTLPNGSLLYNNCGITIDAANGYINFPPTSGRVRYYFNIQWTGGTTAAVVTPTITATNMTVDPQPPFGNSGWAASSLVLEVYGYANTTGVYGPTRLIIHVDGTFPTGAGRQCIINIYQVNPDSNI